MKRHRHFWKMRLSLEVLTLALVIATLWLSWETRRAAKQTEKDAKRQLGVQTWLEMEKRYDSKEMDESTRKLAAQLENYDRLKSDDIEPKILELFDDIGSLYKTDMIDRELTRSAFSYDVNHWWAASHKYIEDMRDADKQDRTLFYEFQYLAEQLHSNDTNITPEDVKVFLAQEKK